MSHPALVLYHISDCPYCLRVRRYLDEKGIQIPFKDIELDSEALETLMRVGGRAQVPCLFIDGKPLYESLDIIQWFKDHWHD